MEIDDPYIEEDLFPIALEGIRMCPRCMDCEVGVGSYQPPFEVFGHKARFVPSVESLRPEPSGDPSGEPEAWYCKGGCNDQGEHSRGPMPPSFIGRVRKGR